MMTIKLKPNRLNNDRFSQIISWGHWFTLFNILLVVIIGSRYLFVADWPITELGRIYAMISAIGHLSFLTFIFYLVLIFPLIFIIRSEKWNRLISIILATILITALLIDLEIFYRFRMHLNFAIWKILILDDNNTLKSEWQKLFIFVPFILLLETFISLLIWRKLRSLNKRHHYFRPVVWLFIICFFSMHFIHLWADANFYRPITMQRSSLPLSYPLTARHFLVRYGLLDAKDYDVRLNNEGDPFAIPIEYPLTQIHYDKIEHPYNILIMTMDNWNNDNQNIPPKDMPHLMKFAKDNIEFTQHYSASQNDSLNEFSLFYGLDPNYYNNILANHLPSVLLDGLLKQHYRLGLFSSDEFSDPIYSNALFSNLSLDNQAQTRSYQSLANLWVSWYKNQFQEEATSNWFSTIAFKSNTTLNITDQQKQMDNAISTVLSVLEKNEDLKRTIVIITANNQLNKDDIKLNRKDLNVPLIISWPNKDHQIIDEITSHVDIMTTLMQDALNATTDSSQYSQGDNLFTEKHRDWIIAGTKTDIAALYADKTVYIDKKGHYQISYLSNKELTDDAEKDSKHNRKNEKLSLYTFLQIVINNRRFMITN